MAKLIWRHGPEHGQTAAEHYCGSARGHGPQWHVIRDNDRTAFDVYKADKDGGTGGPIVSVQCNRVTAMETAERLESDRLAAVARRNASRAVRNGLWALYRYGHA